MLIRCSIPIQEKNDFKKMVANILVDKHTAKQQQQQEEDRFTAGIINESFFFYDSLVRRVVWIEEEKRPRVRITGSHKHPCIFGAMSIEGKQQ